MNKVPNLRFKEFSGEWKVYKLKEYISEYKEKTTVENQYPVLTSSRSGLMFQTDYFKDRQVTTENNIGYHVIPKGYVTYRSRSDDTAFKFNQNKIIDKGIVSYFYPVFKFKNINSIYALEYMNNFLSKQIRKEIVGTSQLVLSLNKLKELEIKVPSKEEQEKIASFLSLIDKKIELQTEKVEELKKYKKGIMQKIFSQELRLKDDNGNEYPKWEEVKLGNISECLDHRRKPLNSNERAEIQGDIPYYGANGVVDFINDYIFDEDIILLAEDGGNFDDFATRPIAQLVKGKSWVNNHAHVLKSKFNNDFLYYSLVHKDIRKYINGTSRSKLNKSDMLNIILEMPTCEEEQKKISHLLGLIYSEIAKQEEKLELLKKYKQGLLQQMFV